MLCTTEATRVHNMSEISDTGQGFEGLNGHPCFKQGDALTFRSTEYLEPNIMKNLNHIDRGRSTFPGWRVSFDAVYSCSSFVFDVDASSSQNTIH